LSSANKKLDIIITINLLFCLRLKVMATRNLIFIILMMMTIFS